MSYVEARRALAAYRSSYPVDVYEADTALRALVTATVPEARVDALERDARQLARDLVDVIGPNAARYEQRNHLPELIRHDGFGARVERVEFDPSYHAAGRAVWASGLVAHSAKPGRAFEQATLLYLLSLEGEGGHACPATCTIGLARALRRRADEPVRDRWLPPLVTRDYDSAERASQFLTEVQGGSDVGANAARAIEQTDGTFSITGEKWFCSVADAHQFLITARAGADDPGTRGLGCFLVPRMLDGALNGFAIRRLKEKLGTRGLASGEIDLQGAIGWPIGPVSEGFKTAVGVVLNTSRWMTALGCAGMMRRAVLEARAFAAHRRAFGAAIIEYPLVRETLASMTAGWLGALSTCWLLTELEDAIDSERAGPDDVALHRFLVNGAKYAGSRRATEVVRDAIEVFGGNGTIEDFSVLPRLYRDAIVYESWEGTHNVLALQVITDLRKLDSIDLLADRIDAMLESAPPPVRSAAKEHLVTTRACIVDPLAAARDARRALDGLMAMFEIGALLRAADLGVPGAANAAEWLGAEAAESRHVAGSAAADALVACV